MDLKRCRTLEHQKHRLLVNNAVKTITAEQEQVSRYKLNLINLEFDFFLSANSLSQNIPVGMLPNEFISHANRFGNISSPGIILGQTREFLSAQPVQPEIANTDYIPLRRIEKKSCDGSCHALKVRVHCGRGENHAVRIMVLARVTALARLLPG